MKPNYWFVLLSLFLVSCTGEFGDAIIEFNDTYVSAIELNQMIKNKEEFLLIDLRAHYIYLKGHIKNAINIPYFDINKKISQYSYLIPMVIYYQSSDQQKSVMEKLKGMGYSDVRVLQGGFDAWLGEAFEVVR